MPGIDTGPVPDDSGLTEKLLSTNSRLAALTQPMGLAFSPQFGDFVACKRSPAEQVLEP
jgi:hypothetical protein